MSSLFIHQFRKRVHYLITYSLKEVLITLLDFREKYRTTLVGLAFIIKASIRVPSMQFRLLWLSLGSNCEGLLGMDVYRV